MSSLISSDTEPLFIKEQADSSIISLVLFTKNSIGSLRSESLSIDRSLMRVGPSTWPPRIEPWENLAWSRRMISSCRGQMRWISWSRDPGKTATWIRSNCRHFEMKRASRGDECTESKKGMSHVVGVDTVFCKPILFEGQVAQDSIDVLLDFRYSPTPPCPKLWWQVVEDRDA